MLVGRLGVVHFRMCIIVYYIMIYHIIITYYDTIRHTILYYTILYYAILYYTILYYTILYLYHAITALPRGKIKAKEEENRPPPIGPAKALEVDKAPRNSI